MISLLFLKAFSDIGFIYALFSAVWALIPIEKPLFFMAWVLQAAAYSLSYQLREKGALRYLAFAICFLPLLLYPGTKALYFLLPGTIYGLYYAKNQYYQLYRDHQISIFGLFWKLALAVGFTTTVVGHFEIVSEWMIMLVLMVLTAQILLMRALRHDPSVYLSTSYQLTDIGVMAVLSVIISFFSSELVRSNVIAAIKFFYFTLVVPVLLFFIRIVAYVIAFIIVPIKRLIDQNAQDSNLQLITESAKEMLKMPDSEVNPKAEEVVKYVLIFSGLLIAFIIVYALFKYLSPGHEEKGKKTRPVMSRSFVSKPKKRHETQAEESEFTAQIRSRYKAFLKLYKKKRLPLKAATTSGDVLQASEGHFDREASRRLRQLYIAARYDGQAGPEGAEEAKQLLKTLKESEEEAQ